MTNTLCDGSTIFTKWGLGCHLYRVRMCLNTCTYVCVCVCVLYVCVCLVGVSCALSLPFSFPYTCTQETLPSTPLSGMLNKHGEKVRLTFKLETDELWIGTKGD